MDLNAAVNYKIGRDDISTEKLNLFLIIVIVALLAPMMVFQWSIYTDYESIQEQYQQTQNKVEKLEQRVAKLQQKNNNLQQANNELRQEKIELAKRNGKLRQKDVILTNAQKQIQQDIKTVQPRLDGRIAGLYAKEIDENVQRYDLPPELLVAVMFRESSFRPLAVGNTRAIGLMQINPNAHQAKIDENGLDYYETFHLDHNIQIGTRILQDCLNRVNGELRNGLEQYVGGSHSDYINDVVSMYKELSA